MTLARWALPVLSLVAVLAFTWTHVHGEHTAPGPLHPAHAAVPALQGRACAQCHREGAGIDADACLRCHDTIAAQARAGAGSGAGLHGSLPAGVLARCEHCHSEHHGDASPLLPAHAWHRAGVGDPQRYDHAHVGFTLAGVHVQLACARCHVHADADAPPPGGRFVGLSQRCTSCHDDAHAGAFGAQCAACHGQQRPWRDVPHFDHTRLPLVDAHARVGCVQCHEPGSARDVAAERAAPAPLRTCGECHVDPHGGNGDGAALRLDDTGDCARCHAPTAWADARPDAARHAALGFELLGAHDDAACAACHGDAVAARRWPDAAPAPDDCRVCHATPHGAALLAAEPRCVQCHAAHERTFATAAMPPAVHAALGFPLVAPHAGVACAQCHDGAAHAERFPGRDAHDCRVCHGDPHGRQFVAERRQQPCTACHTSTRFHPHTFGRAAHAATAFPLTGAHEAVGCNRCHAAGPDGTRVFAGTPHACARCHVDVHGGAFDRPDRAASVGGRDGCARCHDTAAFAPVQDFDHAARTGHELRGAHAALACAACHPRHDGGGPGMPRLGRAAGTTCAACHVDPHAGQFARDGVPADCARCHEPDAWRTLRFDHDRDTRFVLDPTHAALACAACHREQRGVVRYTPLGTRCGDCHRLGGDGEVRR